jgi:hypothetical protein
MEAIENIKLKRNKGKANGIKKKPLRTVRQPIDSESTDDSSEEISEPEESEEPIPEKTPIAPVAKKVENEPKTSDNLKIKKSKSTVKAKKALKKAIPAKVAAKKPVVPAKDEPRMEYSPMRSSGNTAGGTDPTDGVFD